MATSKFDRQVVIEQLRYIEAQDDLAGEHDDMTAELTSGHDFSDCLWHRASHLIERNELASTLHRAEKLTRMASVIGLLSSAILGVLAANLALSGSNIINIYWLLMVLLGFNLLSMLLLWLAGVSFRLDGLMASGLAKLTRWIPGQFKQKNQINTAADRAWLSCHFSGLVGKWQLSATTHLLWLTYLLAGLALIVMVLLARQYEFVWGTTLLSDSAFVSLTEWLSRPLQALGMTTPTAEQVLQSRVGAGRVAVTANSYNWAQFLLGALLVYGILPRLLLWWWARLMVVRAKRLFKLDYYLPYYIDLRQQLLPQAGQAEINDADSLSPKSAATTSGGSGLSNKLHAVSADVTWVAVEPGEDIQWPPANISTLNDLGQVIDRQTLAATLQHLQNSDAGTIAIAVTAARAPDRGLQRMISKIISTGTYAVDEQPWLVLLHRKDLGAIAEARLSAWYRLAEVCGVPADHVAVMEVV